MTLKYVREELQGNFFSKQVQQSPFLAYNSLLACFHLISLYWEKVLTLCTSRQRFPAAGGGHQPAAARTDFIDTWDLWQSIGPQPRQTELSNHRGSPESLMQPVGPWAPGWRKQQERHWYCSSKTTTKQYFFILALWDRLASKTASLSGRINFFYIKYT